MNSYECPLCDCWFLTESDLNYHIKAHEYYGNDLPSMKNRKYKTIKELVEKYTDHIEKYGRGYQTKIHDNSELSKVIDYNSTEWIDLSKYLKAKNNNQCEICGSKFKPECHHIIPAKHIPEEFLNSENILVLCRRCHNKVHQGYNRKLADYAYNIERESRPKYKVDDYPSEKYCKHCGKFMYSKYETCYECFKSYW